MSTTFLNPEELYELTGRKMKSLQIDALRKMGVAFFVNAAGRAVVTRAAIEGSHKPAAIIEKDWTPRVIRK